jgi:hypothetical protein
MAKQDLGACVSIGGLVLLASCVVRGSRKNQTKAQLDRDPLDRTLMYWSRSDVFTLRDLLNGGVLVNGKTGSGKSTGVRDPIMSAVISACRSGGLIRCAKPEDSQRFFELFERAGRLNDVIHLNSEAQARFNLLDFLAWQGGDTRDVVHAIGVIAETLNGPETGHGDDGGFWIQGRDRELYRAINVLKLAGEAVSGPNLQRFIMNAAQDREEMASSAWQEKYHSVCMRRAYERKKTPMEDHEWAQDVDYWFNERPVMAPKTRSSMLAHVMHLLQVFNSGLVRELLSTTTTFSPMDMFAGKWVLADLPYGQEGRFINAGVQFATQFAVLRRKAQPTDVPVIICIDEYQEAANSFDARYLAQCRSHLGAMICLTQSVPGLYACFTSPVGKSQADALLSNFGTQVFCSCDPQTAEYASKWLGDAKETLIGGSMAPQQDLWEGLTGQNRFTGSFSEQYQPILRPGAFMAGLRTGGPANNRLVDAIVIRTDRPFASGHHFIKATFKQQ